MMDIQGLITVFAIAVLSGLGVGSGGLLIVYLSAFHSLGQLQAQSVNLLFFTFAAGVSLLWHTTHRKVERKLLFALVAGGIAGSFGGSMCASILPGEMLSRAFGLLLIFSGSITLLNTAKAFFRGRKKSL